MLSDSAIRRHNVSFAGEGAITLLMAHGFGCDQHMWRFVAPELAKAHRVVLFDHIGCGRSDTSAWNPQRHGSLMGYAQDVIDLCDDLGLQRVVFVGHSVSAMIGALASIARPGIFERLIMIGPSPRYLNDPASGYVGGFEPEDIEGLLDLMAQNMIGWANHLAPVVMQNPDRPELGAELAASFCSGDPAIGRQFARLVFTGDNRADLPRLRVPTLVMQCSQDVIAPDGVGDHVHAQVPGSRLVHLAATGHCPHMSHPDETLAVIRGYLGEPHSLA
jgi:sigma-B regulation protein RsbQ